MSRGGGEGEEGEEVVRDGCDDDCSWEEWEVPIVEESLLMKGEEESDGSDNPTLVAGVDNAVEPTSKSREEDEVDGIGGGRGLGDGVPGMCLNRRGWESGLSHWHYLNLRPGGGVKSSCWCSLLGVLITPLASPP